MTTAHLLTGDFKLWARTEISGDNDLNAEAIDAGLGLLRSECGRNFDVVTAGTSATARTFRPVNGCTDVLWITDAAEITAVSEDGTTLTVNVDYVAEPDGNRSEVTGAWRPFDRLYRLDSNWHHDGRRRTISVTAKWGWSTTDPVLREALKVLGSDWLANRNTNFGVAGISAEGFSVGVRTNPMVARAIASLRGPAGWGIA